MFIRLEMLLIPLSLNKVLRMHWRNRHKHQKLWATEVMVAKSQAKVFGDPNLVRVKISIQIMHIGCGILDTDNVWGGLKPVFDALVTNGLILDDNDSVIIERTLIRTRVDHKNQQKTIVKITGL